MEANELKTIDINAKEWFDKMYGNSYFAANVTLNFGMSDQQSFVLPFQYGYGDHYIDMANQYMIKNSIISGERHENGSYSALWRYCEDNKIALRANIQSNCKQRELKNM